MHYWQLDVSNLRMVLQSVLRGPLHAQGDALHAMELALALEKLNFQARCQGS